MSRPIRPVLIASAALAAVAIPQAGTIAQSGTGVVQSISAGSTSGPSTPSKMRMCICWR